MAATLQSSLGRVVLGSTPLTIGNTSDNQVVLNDPSVSPRHAEIHPEDQGYSITDMGSASGTFLNEGRLVPHEPRLLRQSDVVRIGGILFTYQATNGSQIEPTVSANSLQGNGSAFPSVVPPPPPAPSPPSYMVAPAQAQKPRRRGLWIALGIGLLVIVAVIAGAVVFFLPTPTKVLTAYCNDLKAGNYQAAYNQYASVVQKDLSEADFAAPYSSLGKPTTCTVGNVNSQNHATLTLTFASGVKLVYDTQVASDKINYEKSLSTPSLTLLSYCAAFDAGDFQTAYNQLSSTIQSQVSESQFASSSPQLTNCTISNLDNAAGSATITGTNSKGTMLSFDLALVQESGTWKISSIADTPTETLNGFCSALTHEDYATAYMEFSSAAQSSLGSADQFASGFSSNKVTNCTVSNVDDTTGKGTISFTYADNSTQKFNATLVKQGDQWFIDSLQTQQ